MLLQKHIFFDENIVEKLAGKDTFLLLSSVYGSLENKKMSWGFIIVCLDLFFRNDKYKYFWLNFVRFSYDFAWSSKCIIPAWGLEMCIWRVLVCVLGLQMTYCYPDILCILDFLCICRPVYLNKAAPMIFNSTRCQSSASDVQIWLSEIWGLR